MNFIKAKNARWEKARLITRKNNKTTKDPAVWASIRRDNHRVKRCLFFFGFSSLEFAIGVRTRDNKVDIRRDNKGVQVLGQDTRVSRGSKRGTKPIVRVNTRARRFLSLVIFLVKRSSLFLKFLSSESTTGVQTRDDKADIKRDDKGIDFLEWKTE